MSARRPAMWLALVIAIAAAPVPAGAKGNDDGVLLGNEAAKLRGVRSEQR